MPSAPSPGLQVIRTIAQHLDLPPPIHPPKHISRMFPGVCLPPDVQVIETIAQHLDLHPPIHPPKHISRMFPGVCLPPDGSLDHRRRRVFFFGKRLFCIFLMDPKDLLALQASFLFRRMIQEVTCVSQMESALEISRL